MNQFIAFVLTTLTALYSHSALSTTVETHTNPIVERTLTEPVNSMPIDKYEGIKITVNINSGTLEQLSTLLLGIGEKKAQLIIDYREKYGPFESVEALMQVKGIGPSTIEKNRNRILL